MGLGIWLNGEDREVPPGTSVAALLAELALAPAKVAVERNGAILPRSLYGQTEIAAGDVLEIVHFIGGG